MPDGANQGSFTQGYNAQIVVDSEVRAVVAEHLTRARVAHCVQVALVEEW